MGRPILNRKCDLADCGRPHMSGGLCRMHWKRLQKNGDVNAVRKTGNKTAINYFNNTVKSYAEDECLLWPYTKDKYGYGKIYINGKNLTVSRLLCAEINGPPPNNKYDAAHSCGNGHLGCVNPAHLRWATRKENMQDAIDMGRLIRRKKYDTKVIS